MRTIAEPTVKSLFLEMRFKGQTLSIGTGFVVNCEIGPVLITNRHNVTGRRQDNNKPLSTTGGIPSEIIIKHFQTGSLGRWIDKVERLYCDDNGENRLWYEHPTLGAKADIVALPLTELEGVEIYPYDFSDAGENMMIGPADPVSVIGFPFGLSAGGFYPVWATGFMASEPDLDYTSLPIVLIDCRSRQGQSGSPVLAYRNGGAIRMRDGDLHTVIDPVYKFISIYSGRVNVESDLGIVWKASAILEILYGINTLDVGV